MGFGMIILSVVGPYLVTRFGGALISGLLIKFGASAAASESIGPTVAAAIAKLFGGQAHTMTPEEQAALAAHVQQSRPQQVAAHPGSTFHNV